MELVLAIGILATAILPLAYSIAYEQRLARALYFRAAAMSLVDGEMEVLAAGEWRSYAAGQHEYVIRGEAARSLPPGRFLLSITETSVRLEWIPQARGAGGRVVREFQKERR